MKHVFALILGISAVLPVVAQQQISFPNVRNQFITNARISWASESRSSLSFEKARPVNGTNIYDYLLQKATAGKLKVGKESWETPIHYTKMTTTPQPAVPDEAKDEQKRLLLHEIFYLDNYKLKSTVVAAAPLANVFTSIGVNLGQKSCFFCCGENKQGWDAKGWVLLQSVNRRINPDSIEAMQLLKQSFGMTLPQALWYGATKGNATITDIVTKKNITAKDALDYNLGDMISIPVYDSTGYITSYKTLPSPAFPNAFKNDIEITQDIYFNAVQNTFHTEIRECFLFVKETYTLSGVEEKRFRLVFGQKR